MKNKKLYNILMFYEFFFTTLLIILIIKVNMLGVYSKVFSILLIFKQFTEIFVFYFFFYKKTEKSPLLILLMDIIIYMQFILLGSDFAAISYGKSQSPIFIQILKILFISFLLFCQRIRIKEIS